jgi:pimeloyl-ACP methyl ester carboxylesterase
LYKKNRKEKIELLKGVTFGRSENLNIDSLSQEVLIVWGDKDQIFPVKMAYELKEILGDKTKLEIIDNTSHVPQIECAQEFNNIVLRFLKGS